MSEAGWAERKVRSTHARPGADVDEQLTELCVRLLLAEHRLAVRVVTREIERVKKDKYTYRSEERCLILGSLETVLKALQKGRT